MVTGAPCVDGYRLVFAATAVPPPFLYPAIFLALTVGGLFLRTRTSHQWARRAFLGLAIFFAFLTAVGTLGDVFRMQRPIAGTTQIEGTVEDFLPLHYGMAGNESFRLDGIGFSYGESYITGGFSQTFDNGGPIREGLQVRLQYVIYASDPVITRLEVACGP